jgi:hypothetical protein
MQLLGTWVRFYSSQKNEHLGAATLTNVIAANKLIPLRPQQPSPATPWSYLSNPPTQIRLSC